MKPAPVLFLCFLVFQIECLAIKPSPYASKTEASELLDNLSQLILGNILAAHDLLEDLRDEVTSTTINVELSTEVDIQQEHVTLEQQVAILKELALAAEADIDTCLDKNEARLEGLPDVYLAEVKTCLSDTQPESETVIEDARYNIDVFFNQVPALNFSLNRCGDRETTCIDRVVDQINSVSDDIPLQIKAEVADASDGVDIVKVKLNNCYDQTIADYVKEGGDLVQEITDCVNRIIS